MFILSALVLSLVSFITAPITVPLSAPDPAAPRKSICDVDLEMTNAKMDFGMPFPPPKNFGELFVPNINHNGFIARTIDEMETNAAHLEAAGIGPWGSSPTNSDWTVTHITEAESCGEKIKMTITGGIAPNHITSLCSGFAFWEVLHFDNGILKKFADKRGPGLFYFALLTKAGVSHEQVRAFFKQQGIPVILHYKYPLPIPGNHFADIDFVQIGPMISEVLTSPIAVPLCSDINIIEETVRSLAVSIPNAAHKIKDSVMNFFKDHL